MKETKGGTFARSDIKLLRKALLQYTPLDDEVSTVSNLIHRLGRID